MLTPSPQAADLARLARTELRSVLREPGWKRNVVGFVAAGGGGMTVDDLEELAGTPRDLIADMLSGAVGRTLRQGEDDTYSFAHETLLSEARTRLGERQLRSLRERIAAWAATYANEGWPEETPGFLFGPYFTMLRSTGETSTLAQLARDADRHDRMLDRTGGDGDALTEIHWTQRTLATADSPDLHSLAMLMRHRRSIADRNTKLPIIIPLVWAVLGESHRATAILRVLDQGPYGHWFGRFVAHPHRITAKIARSLIDHAETHLTGRRQWTQSYESEERIQTTRAIDNFGFTAAYARLELPASVPAPMSGRRRRSHTGPDSGPTLEHFAKRALRDDDQRLFSEIMERLIALIESRTTTPTFWGLDLAVQAGTPSLADRLIEAYPDEQRALPLSLLALRYAVQRENQLARRAVSACERLARSSPEQSRAEAAGPFVAGLLDIGDITDAEMVATCSGDRRNIIAVVNHRLDVGDLDNALHLARSLDSESSRLASLCHVLAHPSLDARIRRRLTAEVLSTADEHGDGPAENLLSGTTVPEAPPRTAFDLIHFEVAHALCLSGGPADAVPVALAIRSRRHRIQTLATIVSAVDQHGGFDALTELRGSVGDPTALEQLRYAFRTGSQLSATVLATAYANAGRLGFERWTRTGVYALDALSSVSSDTVERRRPLAEAMSSERFEECLIALAAVDADCFRRVARDVFPQITRERE